MLEVRRQNQQHGNWDSHEPNETCVFNVDVPEQSDEKTDQDIAQMLSGPDKELKEGTILIDDPPIVNVNVKTNHRPMAAIPTQVYPPMSVAQTLHLRPEFQTDCI